MAYSILINQKKQMGIKVVFELGECGEYAEVLDICLESRVLPESVVESPGVGFEITFASIEDARKFTRVSGWMPWQM